MMSDERAVELSEEQLQAIARALADPRRFAILEQIAAVPTIACSTLREQQIISPATISHHVKELQEAGLIRIEREGRGANLILCHEMMSAYLARLARLAPLATPKPRRRRPPGAVCASPAV